MQLDATGIYGHSRWTRRPSRIRSQTDCLALISVRDTACCFREMAWSDFKRNSWSVESRLRFTIITASRLSDQRQRPCRRAVGVVGSEKNGAVVTSQSWNSFLEFYFFFGDGDGDGCQSPLLRRVAGKSFIKTNVLILKQAIYKSWRQESRKEWARIETKTLTVGEDDPVVEQIERTTTALLRQRLFVGHSPWDCSVSSSLLHRMVALLRPRLKTSVTHTNFALSLRAPLRIFSTSGTSAHEATLRRVREEFESDISSFEIVPFDKLDIFEYS